MNDTSLLGDVAIGSVESIHDDDMHAANTLDDQNRVGLRENSSATLADGALRIVLPPVSWTAITLR